MGGKMGREFSSSGWQGKGDFQGQDDVIVIQ